MSAHVVRERIITKVLFAVNTFVMIEGARYENATIRRADKSKRLSAARCFGQKAAKSRVDASVQPKQAN